MQQQISADTEICGAGHSSNTIRVDAYKMAHGRFFTVYSQNRCWKRFRPINSAGLALWYELDVNGNRSLVSKARQKWLERIRKRRRSYPRVRRYPRNDAKGEGLLSDLADAHANGQIAVAITLVDQIKNHLGSLIALVEGDSIWSTLPQFDPTSVTASKWLISSFLAEGSIQLVCGERGSFKSTLMLAAAKAVADREEFLGLKTRRRRVLYLDYENPATTIKARNDDLGLEAHLNKNLKI